MDILFDYGYSVSESLWKSRRVNKLYGWCYKTASIHYIWFREATLALLSWKYKPDSGDKGTWKFGIWSSTSRHIYCTPFLIIRCSAFFPVFHRLVLQIEQSLVLSSHLPGSGVNGEYSETMFIANRKIIAYLKIMEKKWFQLTALMRVVLPTNANCISSTWEFQTHVCKRIRKSLIFLDLGLQQAMNNAKCHMEVI